MRFQEVFEKLKQQLDSIKEKLDQILQQHSTIDLFVKSEANSDSEVAASVTNNFTAAYQNLEYSRANSDISLLGETVGVKIYIGQLIPKNYQLVHISKDSL